MFKYYAVHRGWARGIFESFREVKDVTQEYEDPVYKGFNDKQLAQKWLNQLENEKIVGSTYKKIYYYAYRDKNIKKIFDTKNDCVQFQKKNAGEYKEFLFKDEAEQWLYQDNLNDYKKKINLKIQQSKSIDTQFNTILISSDDEKIISSDAVKQCNDKIKSLFQQIETQIRKKIKLEKYQKNLKKEDISMNSSFIKEMQGFQI